MLLAAVVVELFSRKRTLAAGLLITSICSALLIASPAQVRWCCTPHCSATDGAKLEMSHSL